MSLRRQRVLEVVSGWEAVELILKCIVLGLWQLLQISVKTLWKGHRRKSRTLNPIEMSVDSSIGVHCYIKIMGIKYHYVETGPKKGPTVLILGDAPNVDDLWCPTWSRVVRRLAEAGYHVVTLDLRGTGASEGGSRYDLSPPKAVEELATLLEAMRVSEDKPAVVIGFGIGGMLTWYLAHCYGNLIDKFAVIGSPHPNLYWQHPPTAFCHKALHFIQWPHFPELWLADGQLDKEGDKWASSRARDWTGALHYVRGAAWYRVPKNVRIQAPALLVAGRDGAAQLVCSAHYCAHSTLRLVDSPSPTDHTLPASILDFLIAKEKEIIQEETPKGLMGRMLGAVADKGRTLTARLVLPPQA